MRLWVKIDVRQPLNKHTRVKNKGGEWCKVIFKYERLGLFSFVCGTIAHSEQKCAVRFAMEEYNGVRGWSNDLRADMERNDAAMGSKWLNGDTVGQSGLNAQEADEQARASPTAEGEREVHFHSVDRNQQQLMANDCSVTLHQQGEG